MTNTRPRQMRPATAKVIPSIERHYPGADANTAMLVNKLKHRGITDPRAAVRITSSDLMEDAYRGAPQGQTPKQFDNNYSPYSNVNAEAAEEAARHQAEARRRAENERLRQNAKMPAARRQTELPPPEKRRGTSMTPTRPAAPAAKKHPSTAAVRTRFPRDNEQLAESGPREVAIKRVPFPKFAFVLIFLFVVLFFMVQSFVSVYEYKRQNAELQQQISELSEREARLRAELEGRIDVSEIEEWAKKIGMIDGGQVDEKYIDLSGGDIIENFGGDDDGLGSFTTMLSAIRRRIAGIFGS